MLCPYPLWKQTSPLFIYKSNTPIRKHEEYSLLTIPKISYALSSLTEMSIEMLLVYKLQNL